MPDRTNAEPATTIAARHVAASHKIAILLSGLWCQ
jgi:hypothetical protein